MPRKPKPTFDQLDDRNRDESDEMNILLAAFRKLFTDGVPMATGDIEIGAVELKNSNTDARANILAANTARTTGTIVLAVQHIDAAGNVLPASPVLGAGSATIGKVGLTDISEGEYETVAASATDQALGATGATGDYLAGLLIVPATTSPGAVSIKDGSGSAITVFTGGASSVSNLVPFFVPLGIKSTGGAWKVTTGTNVSAIGVGNFSA